jgi:hypothetical protein
MRGGGLKWSLEVKWLRQGDLGKECGNLIRTGEMEASVRAGSDATDFGDSITRGDYQSIS